MPKPEKPPVGKPTVPPGETVNLNITCQLTITHELSDSANRTLKDILARVTTISAQETAQMVTIEKFKSDVDAALAESEADLARQTTVIDSVASLMERDTVKIDALTKLVEELQAGGAIPDDLAAEMLQRISVLRTTDKAEIERLAAAFIANNKDVVEPPA